MAKGQGVVRENFDKMLNQLKEFFGRMSKKQKIKVAVFSSLVIIMAIVTVAVLSGTTFVTLLTATNHAEAGEISVRLDEMGVNHRVEGLRIMVPEGRRDDLLARLAMEGVGGFAHQPDISILDQAAGFGVTDDHRMRLYEIQRSQEIATILRAQPRIRNAFVIVNFGDQSPFHRPGAMREASATITLDIAGARLAQHEAEAIGEVVRTAVSGISLENITIIDQYLNHYRLGEEAYDPGVLVSNRLALESQVVQRMNNVVFDLLRPIYGPNNFEVQSSVVLCFDQIAIEEIEFSPPVPGETGGIVRSAHELAELRRGAFPAEGPPGTEVNLMGTLMYPWLTLDGNEDYIRAVYDRNYEINQIITQIQVAQGQIREASIAVLLNSETIEDDFTVEVRELVAYAVGLGIEHVRVHRLPFAYEDETFANMLAEMREQEARQARNELINTILRWAIILLLGIFTLLLLNSLFRKPREEEPEAGLALAGGGIDYMIGEDGEIMYDPETGEPMYNEDLADGIELRTKSSHLEAIEKFIERNPSDVAQLLRNWLTEE